MPLDIRAFIFDLDGVITDTAEFHFRSWERLAHEEGLSFTRQDNEALRGVSRRESLNRLLKGKPIDEATALAWMTRKNGYYLAYLEEITPADVLSGVSALLDEARAAGIHLIFAAQRPDVNVFPMQLRDNLDNRLILKVASVGTSEIALKQKGAELLLGKGHLAANLPGEAGVIYGQVPLMSNDDVYSLVACICNSSVVEEMVFAET